MAYRLESQTDPAAAASNYKLVVLEQESSLSEMKQRIWKEFRDERIFFIFPDLERYDPKAVQEISDPKKIEEVLNQRTRNFLRDPKNVELRGRELRLDPYLKQVAPYLKFNYGGSQIKKKSKFKDEELNLINFLYQHAENEELRSGLAQLNFKILYPAE